MSESYEQLIASATGEGGDALRAVVKAEADLRKTYRSLKEDPRLTEEGKSEQAWAAYERSKDKIAAAKEKAREQLAKDARSGERFSIPMPAEESVITNDTAKLLASQNEYQRVMHKVERTPERGPFKADKTATLKGEYRRGLEAGGVRGGAICRGVLDACDQLGVDKHSVVEDFRKERHRESFERAAHSERLTMLLSKQAPEPPFKRPGARGRGGDMHTGRNNFLVRDRNSQQIAKPQAGHIGQKKRRPAWK